jgi:hypothetical protein
MTSRNRIGLIVLALLGTVIGVRAWFGFRSQPQLPPSDEVFKTVDSLFTAITARDEGKLAACEQRLNGYKERGLLPVAAARRLDRAIAAARGGQWEAAAHQLYAFMLGQRREGTKPAAPVQTAMR